MCIINDALSRCWQAPPAGGWRWAPAHLEGTSFVLNCASSEPLRTYELPRNLLETWTSLQAHRSNLQLRSPVLRPRDAAFPHHLGADLVCEASGHPAASSSQPMGRAAAPASAAAGCCSSSPVLPALLPACQVHRNHCRLSTRIPPLEHTSPSHTHVYAAPRWPRPPPPSRFRPAMPLPLTAPRGRSFMSCASRRSASSSSQRRLSTAPSTVRLRQLGACSRGRAAGGAVPAPCVR